MRVIIAGSRGVENYQIVLDAILKSKFDITTIISGTAKGIDKLGERYAEENGILLEKYPADWKRYKQAAGHIRNAEMALVADGLIAIWDGYSPGTKNMISLGKKHSLKCYVHNLKVCPLDSFFV